MSQDEFQPAERIRDDSVMAGASSNLRGRRQLLEVVAKAPKLAGLDDLVGRSFVAREDDGFANNLGPDCKWLGTELVQLWVHEV